MSLIESNDTVDNQNSQIKSHLKETCCLITVSFLLAILPTGVSLLLAQLVPKNPATIALFNTLHFLSPGFNSAGWLPFIVSLVPLGMSYNHSKSPIPNPNALYIQILTQNSQLDTYRQMQQKLLAIKGYVMLKIYLALPADLYEACMGKTYRQLILETNYLTGKFLNADVRCNELDVDREIALLVGCGSAKEFSRECETFQNKFTFTYKKNMNLIIPIVKWLLVVIWITSVTDLSDALATDIPLDRILSLWLAIFFFYVGRSFADIYGQEEYLFEIIEKNVSVKEFYKMKDEELDLTLANLANRLVFY